MTLTKINSKGIKDGEILNADINASAAIAGTKISPDFGSQTITTTGNLNTGDITLTDASPSITFTESDANPDYKIVANAGQFRVYDITNSSDRFVVNTDGHVDVTGNLDVGAGLDVTGNITGTGNITTTGTLGSDDITITGGQPALSFIDDGANPDYKLYNNNGVLRLYDITNAADRLVVNTDGNVDVTGNLTTSGIFISNSSSSGDYVRVYAGSGTGKWDIYGNGANLRIGNNDSGGIFQVDHSVQFGDGGGFDMNINGTRHQFSIGGSEKMRITSDGDLGIGTSSPDGRLHCVTGAANDNAHVTFHASATTGTNNTGEVVKIISSRGTGNTNPIFNVLTNTNTQVFSAHGNGNVGIGTPNPDKTLEIRQTNAGHDIVAINRAGSNTAAMYLGNDSSNNGVIASNNSDLIFGRDLSDTFTERMRLTNAGSLYVNNSGTLNIGDSGVILAGGNGIHKVARDCSTGAAVFWVLGGSGQAYVLGDGDLINSNGNYDGLSDQRLKENIVDANSQWDDIKAVKVRNYNFKESTKYSTHKQIGVIAQELEASGMNGLVKDIEDILYIEGDELPEGKNIGDVKEEGCKAVSYSVLYMKALKALQEAMTKIETLETKVAALEAA